MKDKSDPLISCLLSVYIGLHLWRPSLHYADFSVKPSSLSSESLKLQNRGLPASLRGWALQELAGHDPRSILQAAEAIGREPGRRVRYGQ